MKQFVKKTGKRLTAFLLCGIMCLMAMPMSAFAFTAEVGKTVDASYGGWYLGSDGKYYETDAYNLANSGEFRCVRVGGQYRISKKSFDKWLDALDDSTDECQVCE